MQIGDLCLIRLKSAYDHQRGAGAYEYLLHDAADMPGTHTALSVAGNQHQSNGFVARTLYDLLGSVAVTYTRRTRHTRRCHPGTYPF